MLTRASFIREFGRRAVFGMVHLEPLPGAPLFGGSMERVIDAARADAKALAAGGCDGIVFENHGDRPFARRAGPETVAAMTRVIAEVIGGRSVLFGVNVLRNDPIAALAIAAATGARFIRVNVHTGAMLTDQGIIEGEAAETLRRRAAVAPEVRIFADHLVKHAVPLAQLDEDQAAKDLRERGLADAIIVSGRETGAPADPERLRRLRRIVGAPMIVGSGLTADNSAHYRDADGAIVGSAMKRDGRIDAALARNVVRSFKKR